MKFKLLAAILLIANVPSVLGCPTITRQALHQVFQNHQPGMPIVYQGWEIVGMRPQPHDPIGIAPEILTDYRQFNHEVRDVTLIPNTHCDYTVVSRNIYPPTELRFTIRLNQAG